MRVNGRVKWFSASKGFGIITPSDGHPECVVHLGAILIEGARMLSSGDRVAFDIVEGKNGLLAENVTKAETAA